MVQVFRPASNKILGISTDGHAHTYLKEEVKKKGFRLFCVSLYTCNEGSSVLNENQMKEEKKRKKRKEERKVRYGSSAGMDNTHGCIMCGHMGN